MKTWLRVLLLIAALVAVLTAGVAGYMVIEGWSFLDAVYMTVTTVTTVGYREILELSDEGRIFTIGLIVFGVGVMLYGLTTMHSRDRDLILEDVTVGNGSPVAGKSLKDGGNCCGGTVFLAVKKRDGTLLTSPAQETPLELGDELVVLGTRQQLRALEGPA